MIIRSINGGGHYLITETEESNYNGGASTRELAVRKRLHQSATRTDMSSRASATSWDLCVVSFPLKSMQSRVLRIIFTNIHNLHSDEKWVSCTICLSICLALMMLLRIWEWDICTCIMCIHLRYLKIKTAGPLPTIPIGSLADPERWSQGISSNGQEFTRSKVESHWGEWWMPL